MAELVCEHEAVHPGRERRFDDPLPEEDAPARPETRREGVRLAEPAQHPYRDMDVLDSLELRDIRSAERTAAKQPRGDEGEEGSEPDEDRRREQPPPLADPPCTGKAHHDRERSAEQQELRPEREPVADRGIHIGTGEPVVVLPPDAQHRERQLRDPDEREADHPEQHPGADRSGRRLSHPPHAVAGEEAEHRQLRDRLREPEETFPAAVVLRAVEHGQREERAFVEVRQVVRR
jgi:hypothetical protein